jgi:hypothetical protein
MADARRAYLELAEFERRTGTPFWLLQAAVADRVLSEQLRQHAAQRKERNR